MNDEGRTSLAGRTLAHYRISAAIGAGGMGEVYRATDTKLAREIALKVLPPAMANDPDRLARFQREARAVAALNHPNVVTVYSVEECDNVHFITMELLEGQPLDRLISANGLASERIIEIAGAVAEALSAAHEKGIVHRDLKPANVMVTNEGRVKVLDFGLAKDVGAETANGATMASAGYTQAGMVMGTPAYMSPEQVSGRPLDHRSDIFSFGVMLHEMATGRRPFEGNSSAELISSILRDSPPSVTDVRPELPSDIARVIRRCLEKEPRHRVQTARDVSNEFRDLSKTITRPAPASTASVRAPIAADSGAARADEGFWVAVLPFKYTGGNPDLKALAEGLSEEVVTGLSRFSYLRVIARASTAKYSSESGDVRAIGKELGSRYVMEGTLRQAGATLRIAVQLVDAVTSAHLWAETYERIFRAEDVFAVQDDITDRVVATVADANGVLVRSITSGVEEKPEAALTALDWVLRCFSYRRNVTPEAHAKLRDGLERFVEREPKHADVWACLALTYLDEFSFGFNARSDALGRALAAARRSVTIDRARQNGNLTLAEVHFFRKDVAAFRAAAEEAIALNPRNTEALAQLAMMFVFMREFERGAELARRAMDLNPHHPGWYHVALVWDHFERGEYEQALDRESRINIPGLFWQPLTVAACCGLLGRQAEAIAAAEELRQLDKDIEQHLWRHVEIYTYASGFMDRILEGLAKAGLHITVPAEASPKSEELRAAGVKVPQKDSGTSSTVSTSTTSRSAAVDSEAARAEEGFWVAVLPFKYSGSNQDLKALAEGLSEEVVTGLSRFSYLRVIARASTARYSSESGDVRAIGKELGARYVMDGSIRQAGAKVRIAVQLVDSSSGASLWAETYDRSFSAETMLDILDDVVPRMVCTVADTQGILAHSMTDALRNRDPETLTPYEAVLRSFGHHQRVSATEHLAARTALEHAVKQPPDRADCWATLAWLYREEYTHGFNPLPDPLGRALAASRRALDAGPTNHLAQAALASILFFLHDTPGFRAAAERAIALNPLEGYTLAYLGMLIAYSGDWERGCALADRAMQLNPNHPGWYWFPRAFNAYRQRDYRGALETVLKVNMPGFWRTQLLLAAANGQLGERTAAENAVRELLRIRPNFKDLPRDELKKWHDEELKEHLLEGLSKAGFEIADAISAPSTLSSSVAVRTASGESRAEEGFWVAVLPFKYSGSNQDLKALAEGLSEEMVTGLSRFSYLRVIARGSTAKYSSESEDVRAIGRELGARYVMEGSLRHAGSKLRVAVQLVDATTGSHVWAETYERAFNPETVFELQDELVPRIVSTVADAHGILPHTMGESIRSKNPEQLSPYEAVLRCFSYAERVSPEEHAIARDALERAVEVAPNYAYAWALLALCFKDEFESGFNTKPDPLERMLKAARRAVELDSSGHRGYHALALAHFYRKEIPAFRTAADRAIALNPLDGCNVAHLGSFIAYAGEWERGCGLVERALQLNPNHPGWFWFPLSMNAYRKGDYQAALGYALKINLPNFLWTHTMLAAIYGQLGQREEAGNAVRELLKLNPQAAQIILAAWKSRYDPELVTRLIEGLRKAGLDIEDEVAPSPALTSGLIATRTASGELRASDGFWVALLPFKYSANSADLKALAEGLTEEITTGLSRFSYLRVIARGSTTKYSSESGDVRAIGKELGARYVMEGSLRQAGNKLRLTVQVADTVSGTHLWAETYERAFTPEAIFDLQDDLVPRIVATVADQYGVLPRSISEVLRSKSEDALTPHEAVLRTFTYFARMGPEEHGNVRRILERAVREAADHADCWAMLSMIYRGEFAQGFNARPNPLDRALAAARRAVELAPTHALGHFALAAVYFFRKEMVAFHVEAERALTLNSLDASVKAYLGLLTAAAGEWDRGCQMVELAIQLNPNCPGHFYFARCWNAYFHGKYERVLETVARIDMPGYFHVPAIRAAALGQLGRREEAQRALQDLLALRPDFAGVARQEYSKWHDNEQIERILEGLRKAGMEFSQDQKQASSGN